jgi:hypothetical protein
VPPEQGGWMALKTLRRVVFPPQGFRLIGTRELAEASLNLPSGSALLSNALAELLNAEPQLRIDYTEVVCTVDPAPATSGRSWTHSVVRFYGR